MGLYREEEGMKLGGVLAVLALCLFGLVAFLSYVENPRMGDEAIAEPRLGEQKSVKSLPPRKKVLVSDMSETKRVVGVIEEISSHEVPSKAKGGRSRFETRITLKDLEIYVGKKQIVDSTDFSDPIYGGPPELKSVYKVGDRVKIVCTSRTGRKIAKIERY